jgi:hypothetical protein
MRKLFFVLIPLAFIALIVFLARPDSGFDQFVSNEYKRMSELVNASPDKPDVAAFKDYIQTVDPMVRRVPVERLYEVQKKLSNYQFGRSENLGWEQIPTVMGGRTRALAWDLNDEELNTVWAGSVSGGLWYNENIHDANSPWQVADDFWPSLAVSSIAFDPNNTQTMYVGTGEAETAVITYRESGGRGAGIMKSTDGGITWALLEATSDFYYVTDVAVHNNDGNSVIYAGVTSGVYMGEAHESTPSNGLYRSLDDGESWEQVLPETDGTGVSPVSDIEITATGQIFVGTMNDISGDKGSEIFISQSGEAGTWTRFTDIADVISNAQEFNLKGRVKLASAPSDGNVVYAIFAAGSVASTSLGFPTWEGKYIIRTNDGGANWDEVNIPSGGGNQWAYLAWHALTVGVDPNNPDKLWIGGLDLHRSNDGGQSWSKYSDWAMMYYGGGSNYAHADQHVVKYMPGSSDVAVFATDGGVFYTSNAGGSTTFGDHNKDFNTLQFYSGKISPFVGDVAALGGLQDNGSLLYNGQPLSPDVMVSGGDGGFCYFDPGTQGAYISSVYENQVYVYENSSNNNYISQYSSGTFTSPFDVNFEDERIYANAMTFSGAHQDEMLIISDFYGFPSGDFVEIGTDSEVPYSYIYRSPYSSTNDDVFIGTSAGQLFKTELSTYAHTLEEMTGSEFSVGYISSINMAGSQDTILVTFSNYGVNSVWLTVNGGLDWTSVEGDLPDVPVRFAVFHPENSRQVMLATETGVWTTTHLFSDNVTWEICEDFPFVRTDMLDVRAGDNTLLAATHGRGLLTATWPVADYSSVSNNIASGTLRVSPNPAKVNQPVTITLPESGMYRLMVSSVEGKVEEQKRDEATRGETVQFIPKQSGTYFIVVMMGNKHHKSTLIVQ